MKRNNMIRVIFLFFCCTFVFFGSGCTLLVVGAAAGAGAAGVAYARGDLEATLPNIPEEIEQASQKAFHELKIKQISSDSSALDARIVGRTATDKKITIKAKTVDSNLTKISIRVGTFGDEQLSRRIYDTIKKYLE